MNEKGEKTHTPAQDQLWWEKMEGLLSFSCCFFCRKPAILLSGAFKNAGRLLRMPPCSIPRAFLSSIPFLYSSRSLTVRPYCKFWGRYGTSPKKKLRSSIISASSSDKWQSCSWPSSEILVVCAEKQSLRLCRNGKLFKKSLGKLGGASCGGCRCFFTVPPSNTRTWYYFGRKTQFLKNPEIISHNSRS